MTQTVIDKVSRTRTQAVQYDGTPEGLVKVCRLPQAIPALDRMPADGVTMIHMDGDILMVHPQDYVVAHVPHYNWRQEYRGGVYSPEKFAERFTSVPV